ncbi:hypothetical protein LINGRAHAP2_LOCUS8781, partial [Linum grandiflorum]
KVNVLLLLQLIWVGARLLVPRSIVLVLGFGLREIWAFATFNCNLIRQQQSLPSLARIRVTCVIVLVLTKLMSLFFEIGRYVSLTLFREKVTDLRII